LLLACRRRVCSRELLRSDEAPRQPTMTAVVADIDELSSAIAHATAPAFMLGAVAGFL
jgi:hypothetical protein